MEVVRAERGHVAERRARDPEAGVRRDARTCGCGEALKYSLITERSMIPAETLRALAPIVGKYIPVRSRLGGLFEAHPGHQRRRHLLRGHQAPRRGAAPSWRRSWWWRPTASRARGPRAHPHRPLRMQQVEERWYAVDGTPTDCVNLARAPAAQGQPAGPGRLGHQLRAQPGRRRHLLGHGERHVRGRRCSASPRWPSARRSPRASRSSRRPRFAAAMVAHAARPGAARATCCSTSTCRRARSSGVRFTRLGRRIYQQTVVEKLDPRGRKYYWIAGTPQWEPDEGTDYEAVSDRPGLRDAAPPRPHGLPGPGELRPLRDELERLAVPPLARVPPSDADERRRTRTNASAWSAT